MSFGMSPNDQDDSDDELLGAYLDGELEGEGLAALEVRLAQEERLRARLSSLREADLAAQVALGGPLEETPARFAQMVLSTRDMPAAAVEKGVVVPMTRRLAMVDVWKLPLAAGLALAIGAGGGFFAAHREAIPVAYVVLGGEVRQELAAHLETAASAQRYALPGDAEMFPIASYRAPDGTVCREFSLSSARENAHAVACRTAEGWRLEVASSVAQTTGAEGGFAPVSSEVDPAIDAALDRLGVGAGMSATEESKAIASGWRR
jgi:anti-sigma factor RsiW